MLSPCRLLSHLPRLPSKCRYDGNVADIITQPAPAVWPFLIIEKSLVKFIQNLQQFDLCRTKQNKSNVRHSEKTHKKEKGKEKGKIILVVVVVVVVARVTQFTVTSWLRTNRIFFPRQQFSQLLLFPPFSLVPF